jgi:hypothetical protein
MSSVFLGDQYEKNLEQKLGDIDKAADYLIGQGEICHQYSSKMNSHIRECMNPPNYAQKM